MEGPSERAALLPLLSAAQVNSTASPSSAIPLIVVVHVSPAATGKARVSVPVVTISPAASGGLSGSAASRSTRCRNAETGPSRTFAARPRSTRVPLRCSSISRRASRAPSRCGECHGMANSYQQRAVQAAGCDGVGRLELPAGKSRLHDLETMGDPFDAAQQRVFVHAGNGGCRKSEHDFRLDARLGEVCQRKAVASVSEVMNGSVVHMAPDRRMDIVFRPDVRLVKPILRPTGRSPRAMRRRRNSAVTDRPAQCRRRDHAW